MQVALTGATGRVGVNVLEHLLAGNHSVHALCRHPSRQAGAPAHPNLVWFKGSLADAEALTELLTGCQGLVHVAFAHEPNRYRGGEGNDPQGFRKQNVDQTQGLFELAREQAVERTVYLSSRAVFDAVVPRGGYIDDQTDPKANSLYGQVKLEVEEIGMAMRDLGFCTLRATGVFDHDRVDHVAKWRYLVDAVKQHKIESMSLSDQARTEVHGLDVAKAIELLLTSSREVVVNRSFNCSDVAISERQIAELLRRIHQGQEPLANGLPEAIAAQNSLRCEGLRQLGWVPGGLLGLVATLEHMVSANES